MATPDIELTFRDGGTGDAGDPYTGLDRFGRLVETLWKQDTEERVRSAYGRNRVGGVVWRRNDEAHAQSPEVNTEDNYYWYDALRQVKERQRGNLAGTTPDYTGIDNLQQEEDWTYDATGNWASYSNPSTDAGDTQTRTHNTANEITEISATAGEVEPGYDPAGNMLTLPKEPGISTEQYDLVWDAWNRLVAVKEDSTVISSYTYDGLTRRLTKTNATETRHYYYNKDWRALEERVEEATSLVDRQYTWGLRDRWDLFRRKRSVSGDLDEAFYVLKDYLDPVAIVDDSGNVVERYAYDAFGNVRFLAPDYSNRSASDFDWGFLFHAEFRDTDTKLFNYGYRYYNTGLGRWLSRDPIGEKGGLNLYTFVENATPNAVDLLGHASGHGGDNCTCTCEWITKIKITAVSRPNIKSTVGTLNGADITITFTRSAQKRKTTGVAILEYWELFSAVPQGNADLGEVAGTWYDQVAELAKAGKSSSTIDAFGKRPCIQSADQDWPIRDKPQFAKSSGKASLSIAVKVRNPECAPAPYGNGSVSAFFDMDVDPTTPGTPGRVKWSIDKGGWQE
jgi:RHS repeat-associated protein